MKKLFSVLLTLIICVSVVSCGTNSKTSGEASKDDKLEKKISAVAKHLELKDESDVEYQMIHAKDGKSYNDEKLIEKFKKIQFK